MPRAASIVFVTSFLLLNVYLAWDSGLLRAIAPSLFSVVNGVIQWQDIALWKSLNLDKVSGYAYIVADLENLGLLAILIASSAWLGRGRGFRGALLRSAQVTSSCIVAFGVELGLLDCSEFFMHVTDFQESFNILPWFSNAYMLFTSMTVLVTSTLLLNHSRLEAEWSKPTIPSQAAHRVVVNRRNLDRFLVLILFGAFFIAGGWVLAYYGGVWLLSYSTASSTTGNIPHHLLTSYSECQSQMRLLSTFPSNPSCSRASLNSGELAFVGLGGISMSVGLFDLRKRPTIVPERVSKRWWLLALSVPLLGGVVGYFVAREKDDASRTGMILLGVETLLVAVLLLSGINLMGINATIASACSMPAPLGY